jgi:malonate-semialdehyde dehydrogenase (acetylating) / methylmalonate-semialdehyde dehydrogenase
MHAHFCLYLCFMYDTALVPMRTVPTAIALGNCVILKPSDKAPLTIRRIAELMVVAGVPPGVFQVVHGSVEVVNALCDHPGISAVTFVGSSKVAEIVSKRCHAVNKRVLALGGAKNHLLALPDCEPLSASRDIVDSFVGCAGQRCLAASVLLLVGDGSPESKVVLEDTLLAEVTLLASQLSAGQQGGEVGPLISEAAQQSVLECITEAQKAGAKILLDGRPWATAATDAAGSPSKKSGGKGYWVGPTIILHSSVNDRAMKEEIFGPVLSVYHASSWDEAITIENNNPYGNAACIYTEKGANAEWFIRRFRAAIIGVNESFPPARGAFTSCALFN